MQKHVLFFAVVLVLGGVVQSRGDCSITAPKSGDRFTIGDTIAVMVAATTDVTVCVRIYIGEKYFLIPNNFGFKGTLDPQVTTSVRFIVPPYFIERRIDPVTGTSKAVQVSAVSGACYVCLVQATIDSTILAISDGYFTIRASGAAIKNQAPVAGARPAPEPCRLKMPPGRLADGNAPEADQGRVYSILGRRINQGTALGPRSVRQPEIIIRH